MAVPARIEPSRLLTEGLDLCDSGLSFVVSLQYSSAPRFDWGVLGWLTRQWNRSNILDGNTL